MAFEFLLSWLKTKLNLIWLDFNAFDQWCLPHPLRIFCIKILDTNEEVRCGTCQQPVTSLITIKRLRLLGHMLAPIHHRIYSVSSEQQSADSQWTESTGEVDLDYLASYRVEFSPTPQLILLTVHTVGVLRKLRQKRAFTVMTHRMPKTRIRLLHFFPQTLWI